MVPGSTAPVVYQGSVFYSQTLTEDAPSSKAVLALGVQSRCTILVPRSVSAPRVSTRGSAARCRCPARRSIRSGDEATPGGTFSEKTSSRFTMVFVFSNAVVVQGTRARSSALGRCSAPRLPGLAGYRSRGCSRRATVRMETPAPLRMEDVCSVGRKRDPETGNIQGRVFVVHDNIDTDVSFVELSPFALGCRSYTGAGVWVDGFSWRRIV